MSSRSGERYKSKTLREGESSELETFDFFNCETESYGGSCFSTFQDDLRH